MFCRGHLFNTGKWITFPNCGKGVIHNSVSLSIEVQHVPLLGYEVNTIITCLILIKAAANELVSWSYRRVVSNACLKSTDFITNDIREGCDGEHFGQNCCMPSSEVVSYNKEQSLNMSSGVNSVGVEWVTSEETEVWKVFVSRSVILCILVIKLNESNLFFYCYGFKWVKIWKMGCFLLYPISV